MLVLGWLSRLMGARGYCRAGAVVHLCKAVGQVEVLLQCTLRQVKAGDVHACLHQRRQLLHCSVGLTGLHCSNGATADRASDSKRLHSAKHTLSAHVSRMLQALHQQNALFVQCIQTSTSPVQSHGPGNGEHGKTRDTPSTACHCVPVYECLHLASNTLLIRNSNVR